METIKYPRILPIADSSVLVEFGNEISDEINAKISGFTKSMTNCADGIIEIIPTFRSVLVAYNPKTITYGKLCGIIERKFSDIDTGDMRSKKVIEIPVCYGGKYGPDLGFVAEHAGMSEEEVIELHSSKDYLIFMLGFQPGFPYLGGLDPRLFTPRLQMPRSLIPAGSVGIGGEQTGLYPVESPAGWQIIGNTPVKAYNPKRQNAIPYEAGDMIRFVPISETEYQHLVEFEKTSFYEFNVRYL